MSGTADPPSVEVQIAAAYWRHVATVYWRAKVYSMRETEATLVPSGFWITCPPTSESEEDGE